MPCFFALDCSTMYGSLSLTEGDKSHLRVLASCEWELSQKGKILQNAHSDKLPFEADRLLRAGKKSLSDLDFVAVGKGPGRWTGLRAGLGFARALAFGLKIPIRSVDSLRISAEPFLPPQGQKAHPPVFVSMNGFGGKIYHASFSSKQESEAQIQVLSFSAWQSGMEEKLKEFLPQSPICVCDVGRFYPLSKKLKALSFKALRPKALHLSQIVLRQNKKGEEARSAKIQALYLKAPVGS